MPILLFVFPEFVSGNNSTIEAPPGYQYSHGDEFSGSELDREMWGLGINEKNLKRLGLIDPAGFAGISYFEKKKGPQ